MNRKDGQPMSRGSASKDQAIHGTDPSDVISYYGREVKNMAARRLDCECTKCWPRKASQDQDDYEYQQDLASGEYGTTLELDDPEQETA